MDIKERLIGLLQDGDNPAWCWFPDNASMVELVDYLLANDVTITRHGWWERDEWGSYLRRCSVCKKSPVYKDERENGVAVYADVCINCGAKMSVI